MAINQEETEQKDKQTCLYDKHVALGALMSPFGGFIMPIQYAGIAPEHMAVREKVGLFDVSHMGEVTVRGKDAERYVQHIFTNDIANAPVGKIYYGMMCYENGGTVDDLLVYKMGDNDYGQIAVQGPESEHIVETVLGLACAELTFYTCKQIGEVIISRTGYTGEDGFEIYASHDYIRECWDKLIAAGVQPCGLGCRDTLRFEVGLPLYGDELSQDITPVMAGLSLFVKFDKPEFVGREALLKQKTEGPAKKLVGIELFDKAIPRHGYTVLNKEGAPIGEVTTGYHTLSTDKSVCMALVDAQYAKLDAEVEIQIRKKVFAGKVVKKQFYNKNYKK